MKKTSNGCPCIILMYVLRIICKLKSPLFRVKELCCVLKIEEVIRYQENSNLSNKILHYLRQFWQCKNSRPHFESLQTRHFRYFMFQLEYCCPMDQRRYKSLHWIPMFIGTPCTMILYPLYVLLRWIALLVVRECHCFLYLSVPENLL